MDFEQTLLFFIGLLQFLLDFFFPDGGPVIFPGT